MTKKKPIKSQKDSQCCVCKQLLFVAGGYSGLGMCGPCATGEAATLDEAGETW